MDRHRRVWRVTFMNYDTTWEAPPTVLTTANPREISLGLYIPIVLMASAIAGLITNDPLGALTILVLATGWRMLYEPEGPPVMRLVFVYQWAQVSIGVLYFGATGRYSTTMAMSDYRPMVLIGLGSVCALFGGIIIAMHMARKINPGSGRGRAVGLTNRDLIILYLGSLIATGSLLQAAGLVPGLYQAATVLAYLRYAPLYLAFHRLAAPRFQWKLFMPLLAFEVLLGFTGFFADFREPIVFATLALLQVYDVRKVRHTVVMSFVAVAVVVLAVTWTAIKPEYRSSFDAEASRGQRVSMLRILTTRLAADGSDAMASSVDMTVDRLWTVYYPALAVERVPALIPHTNGDMMWTGIRHVLTPRLFFPSKPPLVSNSEKVREYSGMNVAGEEVGTSIAFGYAAELYIDFGVPGMFLPLVILGMILFFAFRRVARFIRHRDLALAMNACIVWFSIYQFEQSWARMLGFTLTLLIVLGGAGVLIDRYISRRHRSDPEPMILATPSP